MKLSEIQANPRINLPDLAALLNLTERRINQLSKDGIIPKESRGEYNFLDCQREYLAFLSRGTSEKDRDRLVKAQADKIEYEVQELKKLVVRTDLIKLAVSNMISSCRSKLLSIPTKLAPLVMGCESIAAAKEQLEKGVFEALADLRGLDTGDFVVNAGGDAVMGPSDETQRQPMGGPGKKAESGGKRRARKLGYKPV